MVWTNPRTWTDTELVDDSIMNQHIRDNLLLVPHFIVKDADELVASSTTLQNDDDLFFAMATNESWAFFGTLWLSNAADAGHFKMTFTVPASGSFMATALGVDTGGATLVKSNLRSASDTAGFFATTTGVQVTVSGIARTAGTAGNLQLQWAQVTSNGTATILKKDSHLYVSKLQ